MAAKSRETLHIISFGYSRYDTIITTITKLIITKHRTIILLFIIISR
jgi:hypothetical protein